MKSRRPQQRASKGSGKSTEINAKQIIKRMKVYFQNHPTCLQKPPADLKAMQQAELAQFQRTNPELEHREYQAFKRELQTLNPIYEDKESYDLEECIQEAGRKPLFGYPVTHILDKKQDEEEGKKNIAMD